LVTWVPVFFMAQAAAGGPPGATIAAVDLSSQTLPTAEVGPLARRLADTLAAAGMHARVVTSDELQQALDADVPARLASCDHEACWSQVVAPLGVDVLVVGRLEQVSGRWEVSLRAVDCRAAVTLARAQSVVEGPGQQQAASALEQAMARLVVALRGDAAPAGSAATTLPSAPSSAAPAAGPSGGPPVPWVVLLGVGLASVLAVAWGGVSALAGGGLAAGTWGLFHGVPGFDRYRWPMQAAVWAGLAGLVSGVGLALVASSVAVLCGAASVAVR
jgi:hypothetical protein